jgi:hypothetical protein
VITADDVALAEVRVLCPGAHRMREGEVDYIYLPALHLPPGCDPGEVDALLRPGPGPDGYTTRLFLGQPFPPKGQNWTVHRILDKTWHTFSFNNVPATLRLIEILANHLRVLR